MLFKSLKRIILFTSAWLCFTQIGCDDETPTSIDTPSGKYNVTIANGNLQALISSSEFEIVQTLFMKNNLSLEGLQVFKLSVTSKSKHVRCNQFYQGLKLFTDDVVFSFDNDGKLYSVGGDIIKDIGISFTSPRVSAMDAAKIFVDNFTSDYWYNDSLSAFRSCGIIAELGFYDLNRSLSYASKNFVPAWELTVNNGTEYPKCYVRADSLKLILYYNGVIIGKSNMQNQDYDLRFGYCFFSNSDSYYYNVY